jgi:hypothetical protein
VLFHILSLLDAVAGLVLIGGHFALWKTPLLYVALYLCGKIVFWRDPFSIMDFAVGVYAVFVYFGHAGFLTWLFVAYFLYKLSVWMYTAFGA